MEERSLKITGTDKTFFNKITKTLTKILIPTQLTLNGMRINVKRNAVIKAYESIIKSNEKDKTALEKKYEETYTAYLESLDKYVMDSIYKKVRNNNASEFERQALANYYNVTKLKETEYVEYKYRKQKYLLELDYEGIKVSNKEKVMEKYKGFYISKMDFLYKSILKNYSIKVADSTNSYDSSKEWIFLEVFATLDDYLEKILTLKIEDDESGIYKDIAKEYEKYQSYTIGKLDVRDNIEKNIILLGISRRLFTHSLPLVVVEQCFQKILKDARCLVQDTKIATKREKAYSLLLSAIENYNTKLLATKVYWADMKERENFKKLISKYKEIAKLKETDFVEYIRKKEVLFIKDDIIKIRREKTDYSKLIKYYKRKLVDYDAIKEIKSYRTDGIYKKRKIQNSYV